MVRTFYHLWEWNRSGAVQPFEELAEYDKRPVKLRFTRDMLVRYCLAMEVPLDPTAFGLACLPDT